MKIRWLGCLSFLLTSESDTRVVTDPYDQNNRWRITNQSVEAIALTQRQFEQFGTAVKAETKVINHEGHEEVNDIKILGINSSNVNEKSSYNIIYKYEIDGIRICHISDSESELTEEILNGIGEVDVLLIAIGGDCKKAIKAIELLKPYVTIPAHFKRSELKYDSRAMELFKKETNAVFANKSEIDINKHTIASMKKVMILGVK